MTSSEAWAVPAGRPSTGSGGMAGAFAAAGIRVEGSAAAALAALAALEPVEGPTVLVVTGSNIDDELHRRAVEQPESFPG